jgi:hypothetical protein
MRLQQTGSRLAAVFSSLVKYFLYFGCENALLGRSVLSNDSFSVLCLLELHFLD